MLEPEVLTRSIIQFYSTFCEATRRDLQSALDQFQEKQDAWRVAVELVNPARPLNVQFYGAKVLYASFTRHFDIIAERMENLDFLKNFLIQKLSSEVHSLPHSVFNKLSSALALFLLKTLPDIWADPFMDLTTAWSNQIELLLRIFAEVPLEFQRLNVPLDQRNQIRAELQNVTKLIVQIAQHVLEDVESAASMRNAAIECIEAWLRLPNARLENFYPVFDAIFTNIGNDPMSLARILCTLKANEELRNIPSFVWQVVRFIANSVCPLVQAELNVLPTIGLKDIGDRMDDLAPLICAVVEFVHDFVALIVKHICENATDQSVILLYQSLCTFFFQISTLPGTYPVHECLSDLPEPWWSSLREELLQPDEGSTWSGNKRLLREGSAKWFVNLLDSAVSKLTYSPGGMIELDKEALDKFQAYRLARADVSLNAIQIAPSETLDKLTGTLNAFLDAYDPERSEAVIYLLKETADFLKEWHFDQLIVLLPKCGTLGEWTATGIPPQRLHRFANTFLGFVRTIEHFLFAPSGQKNRRAFPTLINIILSYMELTNTERPVLDTLILILKNRQDRFLTQPILDQIISSCFNCFSDENNPEETRLLAMRCVGMGLSLKEPNTILGSLNQILGPRLVQLNNLLDHCSTLNLLDQIDKEKCAKIYFELSVLAQLVATLENCKDSQMQQQHQMEQQSPVRLILDLTFPLFNKLLSAENAHFRHHIPKLVVMISNVLKGAVQSLYTNISPLLVQFLNFVDLVLPEHPSPASELAKSLFLVFHKESDETSTLVDHLASWYSRRSSQLLLMSGNDHTEFPTELDEKLIELSSHVVKKFWNCIVFATTLSSSSANDIAQFLHSLYLIISMAIDRSRDIFLTQNAVRTLNQLLKNCTSSDNPILINALGQFVEKLLVSLFLSIQSEMMTSVINVVADNLYLIALGHTQQTRAVILSLPNGDSQLVTTMLSQLSTRNFRMRVSQMHQTALLQKAQI